MDTPTEFSSPIDSAAPTHAIDVLAANIRHTADYQTLPDTARAATDVTFSQSRGIVSRLLTQTAAIRTNGDWSEARKAVDVAEVAARTNTELDRVEAELHADRARYEAHLARVADGWLVPDPTGFTLREPKPPAGDELRLVQEIRGGLRALPPTEVEQLYLTAVQDGSDPALVRAVETAPRSVKVVREYVRDQARQIRLANSPAAESLGHARTAIELRELAVGRARRVVADLLSPKK